MSTAPPTRTRTPKSQLPAQVPESRILRITVGGRAYELDVMQLGPGDDRITRAETGLPVSSIIESSTFGADSLLMLFWLARRKAGETALRYTTVEAAYPTFAAIAAAGFELEEVVDDPE